MLWNIQSVLLSKKGWENLSIKNNVQKIILLKTIIFCTEFITMLDTLSSLCLYLFIQYPFSHFFYTQPTWPVHHKSFANNISQSTLILYKEKTPIGQVALPLPPLLKHRPPCRKRPLGDCHTFLLRYLWNSEMCFVHIRCE